MLNSLLSEKGTDASVLLCVLDVLKGWIEHDFSKLGTVSSSSFLNPKEVVSFLQKLSQVDQQNFLPDALEEWERKYVELLYGIGADSNKYPLTIRQEAFEKVERQFMLGLRAKEPDMRTKFFTLYHESVPRKNNCLQGWQFIIQILLTEIGSCFVTLPEERLLAVVNALLHRCYRYPTATTAEVPQSLKKELSSACRACFSTDAVNEHVDFVREYKREFELDLDPESTATFPATLSELTERLKHWKNVLQSNA